LDDNSMTTLMGVGGNLGEISESPSEHGQERQTRSLPQKTQGSFGQQQQNRHNELLDNELRDSFQITHAPSSSSPPHVVDEAQTQWVVPHSTAKPMDLVQL